MLAAIRSAAVLGIDAYDVTVEVDVALGLPQWTTVGLPASAVKESRERVGAALLNSGFTVPPRRITTNLAPADIRKEGTAFDLPIALGVLVGTGVLDAEAVERHTFVGELGLDGSVRPVRGALSIARMISARAASLLGSTLVLPRTNVAEASLVPTLPLAAPATLAELVGWLRRGGALPRPGPDASRAHVEDIAAGVIAGFNAPPGAYNIADDEPASQNEVIEEGCRLLGMPIPPLQSLDAAGLSPAARAFYAENRRVANGKARRVLAWQPRYPSFREGLRALA
jgi:magnesium chelatase family protein